MKHYYAKLSALTLFFVAIVSLNASAQQTFEVIVSNFQFEPAQLAINEGDTVVFINTEGSHNVNGTQEEFPENPESFGNDVGMGWTYSVVFNTSGTYNYHCDIHPNMTGTITVTTINSVAESKVGAARVNVYPNPATDFVTFDLSESGFEDEIATITIYNSIGAIVESRQVRTAQKATFSTSEFETGIYSFRIQTNGNFIDSGSFMAR